MSERWKGGADTRGCFLTSTWDPWEEMLSTLGNGPSHFLLENSSPKSRGPHQ